MYIVFAMASLSKLNLRFPVSVNPESLLQFGGRQEIVERSWGGPVIEPIPLYPHAVEFCRHYGKWWCDDPYNRFVLVINVPEGRLRYRLDGRSIMLSGNDVLIIPRGVKYYFETVDDTVYRKNVLYLMGMNADDILETLNLKNMQPITLPSLDFLNNSFHRIYELLDGNVPEKRAEAAGTAFSLLNYLSGNIGEGERLPPLLKMLKSRFSNDFTSRINIAQMAKEYQISAKTITRMFKEHLGVTPLQFRRAARNSMAQRLLITGNLSIKEIADKLGYSSQFYFSAEFKLDNGMSPAAYRKERKTLF